MELVEVLVSNGLNYILNYTLTPTAHPSAIVVGDFNGEGATNVGDLHPAASWSVLLKPVTHPHSPRS